MRISYTTLAVNGVLTEVDKFHETALSLEAINYVKGALGQSHLHKAASTVASVCGRYRRDAVS